MRQFHSLIIVSSLILISVVGLVSCKERSSSAGATQNAKTSTELSSKKTLELPVAGFVQPKGNESLKQADEQADEVAKGTVAAASKEEPVEAQQEQAAKTGNEDGPDSKKITAEQVKKEAREAVELAKNFTVQTEKEYHAQIDKELREFNGELDALRKRAEKLSEQAKAQVTMEIRVLGSKMEGTTQQLDQLGDLNMQRLKELNKSFNEMLASLESGKPKTGKEQSS